tara:strand:- start:769 stop:1869 length:1101 start_codon:yes stop_codon:yes gene_type:complete
MVLTKKQLVKIIREHLILEASNRSKPYEENGKQLTTGEVNFKWGTYKTTKYKDVPYVIYHKSSKLGEIQELGDPYTYTQLKSGKYKGRVMVVSGPETAKPSPGAVLSLNDSPGPNPPKPGVEDKKKKEKVVFLEDPDLIESIESDISILRQGIDEIKKISDAYKNKFVSRKEFVGGKKESGQTELSQSLKKDIGILSEKDVPIMVRNINEFNKNDQEVIRSYNKQLQAVHRGQLELLRQYFVEVKSAVENVQLFAAEGEKERAVDEFPSGELIKLNQAIINNLLYSAGADQAGSTETAKQIWTNYLKSFELAYRHASAESGQEYARGKMFNIAKKLADHNGAFKNIEKEKNTDRALKAIDNIALLN